MAISRFPRSFGARLILACALVAGCAFSPARAGDAPKTLQDLFQPLASGGCVTMIDVRAVGAVVELAPEQFQFVRAFWMAIPPVSHELPPGDKAFLVKDATGDEAFGLFDDSGAVCAVFQATGWMEKLVNEVGRGEVGKRGDPS
ncbi:MAG: hypothetical protein WAN43_16175 [Rhodomicrobium sp.]